MTVVLALCTGVFALFGSLSLAQAVAAVLPVTEVPVEIIGRDQHTSNAQVQRHTGGWRYKAMRSYTVEVRRLDNQKTLTVYCPEEVYEQALTGLRMLDEISLHTSVLAGRPVRLEIDKGNFVSKVIPAGGILEKLLAPTKAPPAPPVVYDLLPHPAGMFALAFALLGFAAWLTWKLPKNGAKLHNVPARSLVHWPALGLVTLVFLSLGFWWGIKI